MKNDDIVLNMIMNPETPYEAVESISDKAKNSKVDFFRFEAKFDQDKLKTYKVRLTFIFLLFSNLFFIEIFSIKSILREGISCVENDQFEKASVSG